MIVQSAGAGEYTNDISAEKSPQTSVLIFDTKQSDGAPTLSLLRNPHKRVYWYMTLNNLMVAQSDGTVEYTNDISTEKSPETIVLIDNTKQCDGL